MDFDLFLGRFHPMVVHLPIGFLLLAIIFEFISLRNKKSAGLHQAVVVCLIAGCLAAAFTITTGLFLSQEGYYMDGIVGWHKWLGFGVMGLSLLALVLKMKNAQYQAWHSISFSLLLLILVTLTGHFGGSITHGETYLFEHGPGFLQRFAGISQNNGLNKLQNMSPDSIRIYQDLVQPIFDEKCVHCHNAGKASGELILTSYHELLEGGQDGSIINTNTPFESKLLQRVTLPPGNKKFMPINGTPLSFTEIQLIARWMAQANDTMVYFSNLSIDPQFRQAILRDYKIDLSEKPYYEKISIEPVSADLITGLESAGFTVATLGEGNHLLSVELTGIAISEDMIISLNRVAEAITWLKLSECGLTNQMWELLHEMPHLTRLDLHGNPLTALSLENIKASKHLESLNLYATSITDETVDPIVALPGLKILYIWQTAISKEKINDITKVYPELKIEKGFHWD